MVVGTLRAVHLDKGWLDLNMSGSPSILTA
jgi:hypothetical protein